MTQYRPTIQYINLLGTKQRQESLKYLKVTIYFTIFCGVKHIHTQDFNTAFVFFTLQHNLSRHVNILLTTGREAHTTYSSSTVYKLAMHSLGTYTPTQSMTNHIHHMCIIDMHAELAMCACNDGNIKTPLVWSHRTAKA